jgi:hypothetical protein
VVVGRSTLVGLPLALLLERKGVDATVTVAHSRSRDLEALCREADIVIAAAGSARMITAAHVKPGAAVGRRRDLAHGGGPRRRRRLRRGPGRRGSDHADAGRHRSDDDRVPDGEHAHGGAAAARPV